MSRRNNFNLAYQSLRAAKARSFLTMLGIIIGVMAVVLIVSIGQGVKQQIAGQLGGYGKRTVVITPGAPHSSASLLGGLGASGSLLTENDLRSVQKTAGVTTAMPLSTTSGSVRGDHEVTAPFIIATTADFPKLTAVKLQYGGFFDTDVDTHTVVLGETIAHKLFDDNSPLGQTLKWRGQAFIVGGVFNNFNASPFSAQANFNDAVFVPFATAQRLSGSVLGLYQILAQVAPGSDVNQTVTQINQGLLRNHGDAQDFTVDRADSSSSVSNRTIHLLTLLVSGAAFICLIVGGVGIMDVMLVSVTERMHEIGLRKAIGATNSQILRQFMAEAFVLSAAGALIGVLLALGAIGLLRLFSSLQPVIVWPILVIAPLTAIATGLFFGTMPALKAARKDPIEALRHQ